MTTTPKVTYGILSFNRKTQLGNLLTQLEKFRLPDAETVVVDNGSTDGTKDLEATFKNDHTKFVFKSTNTGVSAGWNSLFKHSKGDLVFIFNDDYEVIQPGWEQIYIDAFQDKPGVMCFPNSVAKEFSKWPYTRYIQEGTKKYTHNFRLFGIPRIVHQNVGGFDEKFMYGYEDTDFNMAALKKGFPLWEIGTKGVYVTHLKNHAKRRVEGPYEEEKQRIWKRNLSKNSALFYQKWPHGI